jgi:peptide/nickel transport system substrate-binding protein
LTLVDNNPYIIRFTWSKPYFSAWSSSAGFAPIAEHYYKFDDPNVFNTGKQNQWLVGNGAYKLDKWEHDQRIVFVRNELYYGKKPHVRGFVEKFIKDPAVQLQSFEKGDLDVYGLTPSQYIVKHEDPEFLKRFEISKTIANSYRYVGWNMRLSKFKDKRVRQALTMLIDRERICKDIYRGLAIPIHGTVHPENPAYNKYVEQNAWPFDPKRAKALLAEAGWKNTAGNGVLEKDGEQFRFTVLIPSNNQEVEAAANLIKDSLAQAGIEVSINNLEWKTFLEKIHRLDFQACILGWQLGLEFDPYQLWHSSQVHEKESNHCGYVNPAVDRLIEKSRRELNEEKRFAMLREFQKYILEDQPYTFLMVPNRLISYDKRIHNVQYKLTGADNDRWWVPAAEQKRNE